MAPESIADISFVSSSSLIETGFGWSRKSLSYCSSLLPTNLWSCSFQEEISSGSVCVGEIQSSVFDVERSSILISSNLFSKKIQFSPEKPLFLSLSYSSIPESSLQAPFMGFSWFCLPSFIGSECKIACTNIFSISLLRLFINLHQIVLMLYVLFRDLQFWGGLPPIFCKAFPVTRICFSLHRGIVNASTLEVSLLLSFWTSRERSIQHHEYVIRFGQCCMEFWPEGSNIIQPDLFSTLFFQRKESIHLISSWFGFLLCAWRSSGEMSGRAAVAYSYELGYCSAMPSVGEISFLLLLICWWCNVILSAQLVGGS